jgi:M6 family metalloprotease-like protein
LLASPSRLKVFLGIIALIFLGDFFVLALEKPSKAQLDSYARDGSLDWRTRNALALGNHLAAPELGLRLRRQLERIRLEKEGKTELEIRRLLGSDPIKGNALKSTGTNKIFALLISFPDYPASQSPESIASKLFGDGDGNWPYESLRNYYRRSSYNALDFEGDVLGWYKPSYSRASMPQTPEARETLVKEALQYYYSQGYDFAKYDNNEDGAIDYFMVIWTGPDNGWGGFWWGYQTLLSDRSIYLSGKKLDQTRYSWIRDANPDLMAFDPKEAVHETGHALGLPDYYDNVDPVGPRGGIGGLDMMDGGRGDHNAFSKMLLGWISPQVFDLGKGNFTLRASGNSRDALILVPNSSSKTLDEFYMVQNRFRVGNDYYLPGDGLLVWHVDARMGSDGLLKNNNSLTESRLLSLIEGDQKDNIQKRLLAGPSDYLTKGAVINLDPDISSSAPASGISIFGVGKPGQVQRFQIDKRIISPVLSPLVIQGTGSGTANSAVQAETETSGSGTTYYVDATSGSDSNTGLTTSSPWKTINKVNTSIFLPGDSILFKRGQMWQETLIPPSSGTSGNNITFGAYATGDLPKIDGSTRDYCVDGKKDYITITDLQLASPRQYGIAHTKWNSSGTELSTPGWIIKNCTFTNCGVYLFGPDTIVQENVFVGPSAITTTSGAVIFRGAVAMNCSVLGNTISGYVSRGVWFLNAAHSPTVNDNVIHDIGYTPGGTGGGYGIDFDGYGKPITGTVTALRNTVYNCSANGIEMENCSDGSVISKNLIHDCPTGIFCLNYEACARYAEQRGNDVNGVVAYNIIYHCRNGITLNNVSGVDVWNNTLYDGLGSYPCGLAIFDTGSYFVDTIDFRNNILGSGMTKAITTQFAWKNHFSAFNNNAVVNPVFEERNTGTRLTLAQLQSGNAALNCFTTSPGFINAAGHDFHLLASSPCINRGAYVGLTQDFAGNNINGVPDIGAYESGQPTTIIPPAVTTTVPSAIQSTSAATGGNVSSDGGATVTARGVCWGLTANPAVSGSHTSDGSGTGSYSSSLGGLSPNTTYHVRAYATNSLGTGYGTDIAFTTSQGIVLPAVTTLAPSSVTATGAAAGGNVSSDGGATVTARGVCWGLTANPAFSGSHTTDGAGTGSYSSSLGGLSSNTTYHVRAYAANSLGTAYGGDIPFTTTATQVRTIPFSEPFSGPNLPAGWTTRNEGAGIVDKWAISETSLAGGGPNEASYTWQDVSPGTSRLVTPSIDTTGYSALYLNFRHVLETFESGGVTIRVQTSPDGSTWTDEAWSSVISNSNAGPEAVRTIITQNLNRPTTYVAFLISGNLHYFDKWYIDDVGIAATPPGKLKPPILSFPYNVTTNLPTIINFKWRDTNAGPQESGYKVRIKQRSGEYRYYDVGQDLKSLEISGLLTSTRYYWNVMAVGDNLGGADSAWANSGKDRQFTTGVKTTLSRPVLLGATNAGPDQPMSMILQWQDTNSSPQELRYEVRIKQAGGKYVLYSAGMDALDYLIRNLKSDTTYLWNVRAKGDRKTTADSSWGNSGSDMTFQTGL